MSRDRDEKGRGWNANPDERHRINCPSCRTRGGLHGVHHAANTRRVEDKRFICMYCGSEFTGDQLWNLNRGMRNERQQTGKRSGTRKRLLDDRKAPRQSKDEDD